ncbi:DUF2637 domain-containing protein [Nocardiaceae bacterium NPDC056970]
MRPKTVALAGVAAMTLVLAALMFTLSFDALRALAIEIGVRPQRAWMAPVAIDVAQAAATLGLVAIGVADNYKHARWYCMSLVTVAALLSVAGNSYHAYRLAAQNIARVAAGEGLGFIPQPPVIAATIAAIFPLLWLALLHLFTIMLRVIVSERAQQAHTAPARAADERNIATTERNDAPAKRTSTPAPRAKGLAAVPAPAPVVHHGEIATHHESVEKPDVVPAGVSVDASEVIRVETGHRDEANREETRNGYPQTHIGLRDFVEESELSETVKEVARLLIDDSRPKQVQVAQRLHVDKSTVSRRWKAFVEAAEDEGFTVPPLPRLADAIEQVSELQPA